MAGNEGKVLESPKVTAQPDDELFSGLVTVFVARPVDPVRLKAFQEGLGRVEGFRVKSVGGSAAEGGQVILSVEQPLPLLLRLNELKIVERVSKRGKGVEVTLR